MERMKQPIKINQLMIANRLVMPPMATAKSEGNGWVSQDLIDYYEKRAEGGDIGLIIAEHCYIREDGKASPQQLSIAEGCDMEGLKRLVATIQKDGTKVFCQINHAGGKALRTVTGLDAMSASSVVMPNSKQNEDLCKAMDASDIAEMIECYKAAAVRAKEAGFDGVEIHSAHGYLLNQFYTPLTNKRDDAYTGSTIEGRIRLHLQVIEAVREAVGAEYPLAIRLGACDYMEGGSRIEDAVKACEAFEKAGIDLLDISGGFCYYTHPTNKGQGYFAEITEEIMKKVSIPVILTGGVVELEAAEQLLIDGKADMIGVGRAIFKDEDWAKKTMRA